MNTRLVVSLMLAMLIAGSLLAFGEQSPSCVITVSPSESIQAAINAAPVGAVIRLGSGTWNENIKITKSLTLRGANQNKTVIRPNPGKLGAPVIWIAVPQGSTQTATVTLADLTVGTASTTYPGDKCPYGILIQGAVQVGIVNSLIGPNKTGVSVTYSARVRIAQSTISQSSQAGLELKGDAYAEIVDSTVSHNHGVAGIILHGSCRTVITGTNVKNNDPIGVYLQDAAHATISNSTISDNSKNGIVLEWPEQALNPDVTQPPGYPQVTITDSVISNNALGGLESIEADRVTIIGSTFSHNGFGVLGGGADVSIKDSNFTGNHTAALIVNVSQAEITGCDISGNGEGLVVAAGQFAIKQNTLTGNLFCGIQDMDGSVVTGGGNRMSGNGVDLIGDLPGGLRVHLAQPSASKIVYPNPRYKSVQEAVDALVPGGELVLNAGKYDGGITIDKKVRISAAANADVTITAGSGLALSLIRGAVLDLHGITIAGGRLAGVVGGSDSQATIADCTFVGTPNPEGSAGKTRGIGVVLAAHAQAMIAQCTISGYAGGIAVGDFAQANISHCTISDGEVGVMLTGAAHATLTGNKIVRNTIYGVALRRCLFKDNVVRQSVAIFFQKGQDTFTGVVSGKANDIPGRSEANGNGEAAVCPNELSFLTTETGGEMGEQQ